MWETNFGFMRRVCILITVFSIATIAINMLRIVI